MKKLDILYEEYQSNPMLHDNFTFERFLDLYEERKESTSKSFNSFISEILDSNEKTNSDSERA